MKNSPMHLLLKTSSIWKTAIAAGISWEVATWTGASKPYFAPLAAILCLQVTVEESLWKGYQRILGIICGVLLADTVARFIGIHAWSIGLLVLIGTGVAKWMKLGKQAASQVGVSAMMVLTVGAGHYTYSIDRIVDTLIGAVIAILINMFIFPPDYTPEAKQAVLDCGEHLVERFKAIRGWLQTGAVIETGKRLQDDTRGFVDHLHQTEERVSKARESLRFSPLLRSRREKLTESLRKLHHLRQGYAHATGCMRTLLEWSANGTLEPVDTERWADAFHHVEDVIRLWVGGHPVYATLAQQMEMSPHTPITTRVTGDDRFDVALFNDVHQLLEDFGGIRVPRTDRVVE